MGIISVFAYSYNANDISYSPSNNNWNVHNVKSAIDSIKSTNDTTITNLQSEVASLTSQVNNLQNKTLSFGTPSFNQSLGARQKGRTTSLELDPGEYIVLAEFQQGGYLASSMSTHNDGQYISFSYDSTKSEVTSLTSKYYIATSTGSVNGNYMSALVECRLYHVKIQSKSTISATVNLNSDNSLSGGVALQVVPVS